MENISREFTKDLIRYCKEDIENNLQAYKEYNLFRVGDDNLKEAIATLISLSIQPSDGYFKLGIIHHDAKNFDKAIQCYEKAIEINPKFAEAYHHLGVDYSDKGDFNNAYESIKKAIMLEPNNSDYSFDLGMICKSNNIHDKAIEYLNKSVDCDRRIFDYFGDDFEKNPEESIRYPKFSENHCNKFSIEYCRIALKYNGADYLDTAIDILEKAVEIDPDFYVGYTCLGNVFYRKGERDRAISSYKKAIDLNPKCSDAFFNLGFIHGKNHGRNVNTDNYETVNKISDLIDHQANQENDADLPF